jgi:hypothetical protein
MKQLILFGAVSIAMLATADAALACKCAVTSRAAAMSSAPVVFQGRVVNIANSGSSQVTTMTVTRAIKGVANGATIRVQSNTTRGRCGYDFRGKSSVLVGGDRAGSGAVSVSRCTMYSLNN